MVGIMCIILIVHSWEMGGKMKYKNNMLTEVIFRIDFANPIIEIQNAVNSNLSRKILESFPIQERTNSQELVIGQGNTFQNMSVVTEWKYYGKNRERTLILTKDCLIITLKEYTGFDEFGTFIKEVSRTLFKEYETVQLRRIGMRYINTFGINEGELFDWKDYINQKLISFFDFYQSKSNYSRLIGNIEFNGNDFNTKMQYGMVNPNYPTVIKQKTFIIDFDCYSDFFMDTYTEVEEFAIKAHDKIVELFEKSIEQKMRDLLNDLHV